MDTTLQSPTQVITLIRLLPHPARALRLSRQLPSQLCLQLRPWTPGAQVAVLLTTTTSPCREVTLRPSIPRINGLNSSLGQACLLVNQVNGRGTPWLRSLCLMATPATCSSTLCNHGLATILPERNHIHRPWRPWLVRRVKIRARMITRLAINVYRKQPSSRLPTRKERN